MDPVSAIGVAAAAIAFLDFSLKTLSVCRELRDSGALPENLDIERRSKTLQRITKDLELSTKGTSVTEKRIRDLGAKCVLLSGELQVLLNKIKPNGRSISQALKSALRTIRDKRTIEKLEMSLHSYQKLLDTTILVDIRERVDIAAFQQTKGFATMGKQYQEIVAELVLNNAQNSVEHKETRANLTLQIKQNADSVSRTVSREHAETREQNKFALSSLQSSIAVAERNRAVLKSLFFEEYKAREEQVEEAHKHTFRWIFDDSPDALGRWANFAQWLREDDGMYWIMGKAGSGKSTLMSFILGEVQTERNLRKWAKGKNLLCLSFYFWRAGTLLQRTTLGLLRSLLYQILAADPRLIGLVTSFTNAADIPTWTEKTLRTTFLKSLQASKHKVCIFIDGLDEFEGDIDKLVDLCVQCSLLFDVKLCVSSRPEVPLSRRLRTCKTLRLQDLTYQDMQAYVQNRLEDTTGMDDLIRQIVSRAEGIFLWTSLVTTSLLQGYRNHDDEELLIRRLHAFPKGLDSLYAHMINSIDEFYQEKARIYLRMAELPNRESDSRPTLTLTSMGISLDEGLAKAWQNDEFDKVDLSTLIERCQITEERLQLYCKGFLEIRRMGPSTETRPDGLLTYDSDDSRYSPPLQPITPPSVDPTVQPLSVYDDSKVDFTHRSAYEFLFQDDIGRKFMAASTTPEGDIEVAFIGGLLGSLILPPRYIESISKRDKELERRFRHIIQAASHVQHPIATRDKLLESLFSYLVSLEAIDTNSGQLLTAVKSKCAGASLRTGFLAFCAETEPYGLFEYICKCLKAQVTPKSALCDSALLAASLPDMTLYHFWSDFKRLELVNLLLDRLEEQIPGTFSQQLEQHRSELAWRGHRGDRGQCIDYNAAATDLTIGVDIASALDLVSDAGSVLAWEVLELWAPQSQAEMERTVKPPFEDLVQTIHRFGKLVPDGYAWHNVLLGSLKGITRESKSSDGTGEERNFDMNFAINAPSGVLFSRWPSLQSEDGKPLFKTMYHRYVTYFGDGDDDSNSYIFTAEESRVLEQLFIRTIKENPPAHKLNLPYEFTSMIADVFTLGPEQIDGSKTAMEFFRRFTRCSGNHIGKVAGRMKLWPGVFALMVGEIEDPQDDWSARREYQKQYPIRDKEGSPSQLPVDEGEQRKRLYIGNREKRSEGRK